METCILTATHNLEKIKPIPILLEIDKATRKTSGSPDIAEALFNKINTCSVFVADISIINQSCDSKRKTPNPNVLIELGYAARTLGWEKIICVFNSDYGNLSDLPFDLRNRRVMSYSLKGSIKSEIKKTVSKDIQSAIIQMQTHGLLTDKVLDFLKKSIDVEIMKLVSDFARFINKGEPDSNFFKCTDDFLEFKPEDILRILAEKKSLGFNVLKHFESYEEKFNKFTLQALGSHYYNREILNALIDLYEWFSAYSTFLARYSSEFFIKLEERDTGVYAVHASKFGPNKSLPNRYLLMRRMDKKSAMVCNFGDFSKGQVPILTNYFKFNSKYLDKYVNVISLLIKSVNQWLDLTNREFIMDFTKDFRMKRTDGEWL